MKSRTVITTLVCTLLIGLLGGATVVSAAEGRGRPVETQPVGVIIDHIDAGWKVEEGELVSQEGAVSIRQTGPNSMSLLLPAVQAHLKLPEADDVWANMEQRTQVDLSFSDGGIRVSGQTEALIQPTEELFGNYNVLIWRGQIDGAGTCNDGVCHLQFEEMSGKLFDENGRRELGILNLATGTHGSEWDGNTGVWKFIIPAEEGVPHASGSISVPRSGGEILGIMPGDNVTINAFYQDSIANEAYLLRTGRNAMSLLLPAVQAVLHSTEPTDDSLWNDILPAQMRQRMALDLRFFDEADALFGGFRVSGQTESLIQLVHDSCNHGRCPTLIWRGQIEGSGACTTPVQEDTRTTAPQCTQIELKLEMSGRLTDQTGRHNCGDLTLDASESSTLILTRGVNGVWDWYIDGKGNDLHALGSMTLRAAPPGQGLHACFPVAF